MKCIKSTSIIMGYDNLPNNGRILMELNPNLKKLYIKCNEI